jgi:hypothetical protein
MARLKFVTVLPITLEIALAATAKVHRLPLITKDANITDSSIVAILW